MAAADQAREGEVADTAPGLSRVAAIEDALHTFPEFAGYQGLMPASIDAALPFELAGVQAVAQSKMNMAHRHGSAGTPINKPCRPGLL
jgi:hypothetical protein